MHEVSLALVWHQHQPYYRDDLTGANPMPWVRLHGTKDYWGMAMLLKEVPEFHATINLVPSLIQQLRAYTEDGHQDEHLRISRLPADGLSEQELHFLLDNFFMAPVDSMIRPNARYYELYRKRGITVDSAAQAARRFRKRDILDLQCWWNLIWIHPIAFELDKELAEFRAQGRHWTEAQKQWLLDKQMELLKQVIPLHKELMERGQLELTTTPFFHPILPLLWDKRLARQAMPDVNLPKHLENYAEDAVEQINRAVKFHEEIFGRKPRGMWPSEGSVCQAMIPAVAEAGIAWIATDEEILSRSTDGWVARDTNGYLRNPEMLYRPWRLEERGRQLQIIFRDHAMSDQIGFHYQHFPADRAVDDFLGKIGGIAAATANAPRPALVSIILDGENCWEYYPNSGVDFLRALYRRVAGGGNVKSVRVSEYLDRYPATDRLGHLFAGSWIGHNFGIWIGHPECNRAWDLVTQTRHELLRAQNSGTKTAEQLARAWEELYIAEGSDWFWWFGDSHTSSQDHLFDRLFRLHLQNVYTALGQIPPAELQRPITGGPSQRRMYSVPTGLLSVKVDGRRTYFEWLHAGHYSCSGARGSMTRTTQGLLRDVYFGFDLEQLFLRLDGRTGTARVQLADIDTLRVVFVEPSHFELLVAHPGWEEPIVQFYHQDVAVENSNLVLATDQILEIAIPFAALSAKVDDPVHFFVELVQDEQVVERVPQEGTIETRVPSPDYELIMWQA